MSLNLIIVCSSVPLPPNSGAKVDQWARFRLLKSRGCKLTLVSWYAKPQDTPSESDLRLLREIFDSIHLFPIERRLASMLNRLAALPRYSPHVSTRRLSGDDYAAVLADARKLPPDAVLLDSIYGALTAERLADDLQIPLFLRSHNIEFQFLRSQAVSATRWRDRLAWALASFHLKAFETRIQRRSGIVFDISNDDLLFWRSLGVQRNVWAPPLIIAAADAGKAPPYASREFDLVFVGSLWAPNNLRAITWFVDDILPRLRNAGRPLKLRVAGSRPGTEALALFKRCPEIDFVQNFPDAADIWRQGRILINPMLVGSGINLKLIEMINYDAHIISTSVGARGFPGDFPSDVHIADGAQAFADNILKLIDKPYQATADRIEARRRLGADGIDQIIGAMTDAIADSTPQRVNHGTLDVDGG